MKLSVSLPDEDVEFLDRYAAERQIGSRSAAVQRAIRMLRASELGAAYEEAWDDWSVEGEADAWESTTGDGLS
jgi:Arc/MetJ-type ribon-helix-helix transcriptional regulator